MQCGSENHFRANCPLTKEDNPNRERATAKGGAQKNAKSVTGAVEDDGGEGDSCGKPIEDSSGELEHRGAEEEVPPGTHWIHAPVQEACTKAQLRSGRQ